ncbi:ATP-binding protein [Candidatus Halobeggiatoa sp. HSG11]|nr:ATP-binding protein [Candidatus Halobeggiatoa sp. HSG11]
MINQFIAEQTEAGLDFEINLAKDKRVYCLIGDNAVGKTNLLENMARTLLNCHTMFRKESDIHKYSGIFFKNGIFETIKDCSFFLAGDITLNNVKIKDKNKDKWNFIGFEVISFDNSNMSIDKPLVFIGAKNRGYTKNIDKNHIKILGDKRDRFLDSFIRSFDYMNGKSTEKTEVADWFNSRLIINPNFVPENQNRTFEVIKVFELMQQLEPSLNLITRIITKNGNATDLGILFNEGQLHINSIPIDKLSTGFVSIIKLFQEIVAAYGAWSSFGDESNLDEIEGIVFIDEIESHIHPKWQYRIISLLKESFPKTTFYIATHSPVIISTTDEGEAYELVRDTKKVTAHQLGNPKEWYLADIFAQAFHIELTKPTDNNGNSLIHKLKTFSTKVKDYVNNKNENLKQEAEMLYQEILPSLATDDPRRRALDSLRTLLK